VQSSKVAAEVLARHAHDHNRRHLVATVLEARGLAPRRGVVVALRWARLSGWAGWAGSAEQEGKRCARWQVLDYMPLL